MIRYRIQSGRPQPLWLQILYPIAAFVGISVLLLLFLPFILAVLAVASVIGIIAYWRIRSRLKKMHDEFAAKSQTDIEDVDFEVIKDEDSK